MRSPLRRTGVASVALAVAVAVAFAVGGAGCSGGEESATARRSANRWADTICGDLGRWIHAAESGPPTAAADAALDLRAAVAGTRPPAADDGLSAQGELEKLTTAIEQRVRTADPAEVGETVSDARAALDGIRGLTPGGAVERALDETATCRALRA